MKKQLDKWHTMKWFMRCCNSRKRSLKMSDTQYSARIYKAKSEQTDLINDKFHCSADPDGLIAWGVEVRDQVRVIRSASEFALYTISETLQETYDNVIRMGLSGRQRLGTSDSFTGTLDTEITRSSLTDAQAEAASEFVERLDETDAEHAGLVVCAPHGGMIENYTDEQAELVYSLLATDSKPASCWRCKGWKTGGGAYDRWHITSTEISPRSFPFLGQLEDRNFAHSVVFHGFSESRVVIGGLGPADIKCALRVALMGVLSCEVHIADPGDEYAGHDPSNFCNWLTADGLGGIQIEQPVDVRTNYWQEVAEAVASVFASIL
jgi:phage replication-related protein YjqB (UPF0714/DUF867 family)